MVRAGSRRPGGHPRLHRSRLSSLRSTLVERLIAAVEPLKSFPRLGRLVPEGDGRHREILVASYRIIYRAEGEEIFIVTVVHGRRDLAGAEEKPWEGT